MKKIILLILAIIVLSSGCVSAPDNSDPAPDVAIPAGCVEYKEDICGLYNCMVSNCQCADSPFIHESEDVLITSKEEARMYVMNSLNEDVNMASEMNNLFFIIVTGYYSENIYTVAYDGTIFKTSCGV